MSYAVRLRPRIGNVELVKQVEVLSYEQLAECEAESLQLGYEGGMYAGLKPSTNMGAAPRRRWAS